MKNAVGASRLATIFAFVVLTASGCDSGPLNTGSAGSGGSQAGTVRTGSGGKTGSGSAGTQGSGAAGTQGSGSAGAQASGAAGSSTGGKPGSGAAGTQGVNDGGAGAGGSTDAGADGPLGHCDNDMDCVYRTQTCSCTGMCAAVSDPTPPPPKYACNIVCPAIAFECFCIDHMCTNRAVGISPN